MLKRIGVNQVCSGMFVEAFEGAWQDSLLRNSRFVLRGETDVQKLKDSGVSALIINTARGVDVAGAFPATAGSSRQHPAAKTAFDVAAARATIEQSSEALGRLFDQVHAGGKVSIEQLQPVVSEISLSMDRNPSVFINVSRLKLKDQATFVHSISVSALMILFARYLSLDEETVKLLGMAGLLHDVGKLEIPSEVLAKEGALSEHEIALIRAHPVTGHAILSRQDSMPELVLDVCLNHHERIDGKGYPGKLFGDDISVYARIASICDVYDALTSVRPYKKPWSPIEALKWMLQTDGHFDRRLLKKFTLCLAFSVPTLPTNPN